MRLSPREEDCLMVAFTGHLAQKRLARGLRLNHPEAVALISAQLLELARDGLNFAVLKEKGKQMLGRNQVLPGVEMMICDVQVQATFPDGMRLISVHKPICHENGDLSLALYGSFLPVPPVSKFIEDKDEEISCLEAISSPAEVVPGGYYVPSGEIIMNENRNPISLTVTSNCARPIEPYVHVGLQTVGSHCHFIETNKFLVFDRKAAFGKRLDIPAGTTVCFEPGLRKTITLVDIGGNKIIRGGNNLCDGPVSDSQTLETALKNIEEMGFGNETQEESVEKEDVVKPLTMPRYTYVHSYGPTAGDKIRLGDTSLKIEVEKDLTVHGDECKCGRGQVLRDGMGQASGLDGGEALDTVITNVIILDAVTGIVKADIGIKNGFIVGIGKAGNPDVMNGVGENLVVGACTEAIAGEGLIVTAGAVDTHVQFVSPQLVEEAIASGITTLIGGGTGPTTGSIATSCTPGTMHIKHMLQSTDEFPLNFGFMGKANSSYTQGNPEELMEQIKAGVMGLKLHEDWGNTPATIEACLSTADATDIQAMIHMDTSNESSCVEQSIEAFQGRCIHAHHNEVADGGYACHIIKVCGVSNVLPSATSCTCPYTVNSLDGRMDLACQHSDKNLKEDIALMESERHVVSIAAEDMLHDIGTISMIGSDSQAMGGVGKVITRTWQTADKMNLFRGRLAEETGKNDNFRAKRYLAKYTINPAITYGVSSLIGSIEKGKLADLVLWTPAFFGAKPDIILKGGQIAWAQTDASVPTPQPVKQRWMFGAYGKAVGPQSFVLVSKISIDSGAIESYKLSKEAYAVKGCRKVSKTDMVLNSYCPEIIVHPHCSSVTIKDEKKEESVALTCPPADRLSLSQRYFLF